jgi:hypothetical protein
MSVLVITVSGPFAYVDNFPNRGDLTLMAPLCPQHMAGISSIETEGQFTFNKFNYLNPPTGPGDCAAHIYDLRVNVTQVSAAAKPSQFLSCPWPQNGFEPKEWRFWLRVPQPDILLPVNPSEATITKPDPNQTVTAPFAVGARLIYTHWDGKTIPLWYNGSSIPNPDPPPKDIQFDFPTICDDHAYLEIDYVGPVRDDPFHEDAVSCFASLMAALGLPWSIYLTGTKAKTDQILTTHLHDCKGAVAWVG